MQINYSQLKNSKTAETKKDSVAFRSNKIITEVGKKVTDESLKILGAAAGAITAASIAMTKKAEKTEPTEYLEIPQAYDPIVQESLEKLVKEYGNETVALALKIKNIDVTSKNCDQYSTMKIHELLILMTQCEMEATEENLIFLDTANTLMQKQLFYSDSRAFIPETLKEIKPEAHKAFIEWLEYCNEKVEKAEEPRWNDPYSSNDKKDFVKNITTFVKKPTFQDNPQEYIKLIKLIDKKGDYHSIQKIIDLVFKDAKITPEKVSTYIEILNILKNIKDDCSDESVSLYRTCGVIDDEKVFLKWAKKIKPIFENLESGRDEINNFYLSYRNGETTDERIEKVVKDAENLSKNNARLKREVILKMLKCEPEKYDFYKDWLYKIDQNLSTDIWHLENTRRLLHYILFDENVHIEYLEQNKELYTKLLENTEIIKALENKEIVIKDGFFSTGKTLLNQNEIIINEEDIDPLDFTKMALFLEQRKQDFASEIYNALPTDMNIEELFYPNYYEAFKILANSNKDEIFKTLDIINEMKMRTLSKPEHYLNGDANDATQNYHAVDHFYQTYNKTIYKLINTYDKETIEILMRKRLEDFGEYLDVLKHFDNEQISLLKRMANSCNIDGKPFLPTQKIDLIDLIDGYKNNKLSTEKIEAMIETGKIDIVQLNLDLFYQIMRNMGLSEEEIDSIPKEKLLSWDIRFIHMLAKEIKEMEYDNTALYDVMRAGNFEKDFIQYIHNDSNVYGQTNKKTREIFDKYNLKYDKWIKPSKDLEVSFSTSDKNAEQLSQIAQQITEDMNSLIQSPVKGFIKKQFPKFVKGDEFIIPNEYLTSKAKLKELVDILSDTSEQGQLSQVWKRTQVNLTNKDPQRAAIARNTLTILDHLEQRKNDIASIKDTTISKTLDLTIKMWDRNPQKDIFQGNYSTCCIGIGRGNGSAMPHYLTNTTFNMIEIVDNLTGKIIGNALCYFVIENDRPAFIIDNIEINNSIKPSDEAGKKIREQIVEYAFKIAKSVTGNENTPIYLGTFYNDVPYNDLYKKSSTVSLLGDTDSDDAYLDLYGGWMDKSLFTKRCEMYQLK